MNIHAIRNEEQRRDESDSAAYEREHELELQAQRDEQAAREAKIKSTMIHWRRGFRRRHRDRNLRKTRRHQRL